MQTNLVLHRYVVADESVRIRLTRMAHERLIRTLKEHCIHRQRFDSIQHATRAIGDWISFYNHRRPHQALDMKTPAEAFALAA